ncbi:MAG: endonuclease/exonuclease/phosphatase family protein [Bacteroidetes bacterium]|nr:endonuclease/exonuclease/phosphatase family protein [Bacteroidota bacterium]
MTPRLSKIIFRITAIAAVLSAMVVLFSCEPLATGFESTEEAIYLTAQHPVTPPDTFTVIKVMTWNIRFGAARIPWFGDACGDRVVLTTDEVYSSLQGIADKINELQPDILLLQEVDLNSKRSDYINQLSWLMDHTYFGYAVYGSQWKAQFIPSDGLGRMDEGNVILARWKISDASRIQLDLRGDQDKLTRFFYERCCMVRAKIGIPGTDHLYIVNIHASAFATDDTKHKHILAFKQELDRLNNTGNWFFAGGDLNTLPPGSDSTDYCEEDMCPGESFHHSYDDPLHKDGSNYTPEKDWLTSFYNDYKPAVTLERYHQDQERFFTHTTRPEHFWDRTLDHLFTNAEWVENSGNVRQEATKLSDHAPLIATFRLPQTRKK